jgi:methylenetetrahydrofolate dehydrogenase (NADP+) / methenyltetrahydrofolate cyclohydrolase
LIDGRAIAAQIWSETESDAAALLDQHGRTARLAVLRVGQDPASVFYARTIERTFRAHGLATTITVLPADASQSTLEERVASLTTDAATQALLLQLPLPSGLRQDRAIEAIPVIKDLEGLRSDHAGLLALGRPRFVPSTPLAGLELLRRTGIGLAGKLAVVVGRSPVIGRPLASLLIQADCTVVVCHSRTTDLPALTRQADLLFAAAGRAGLITGEWIKPGAAVVDFGTSELDGKLVGDVDFASAVQVAGHLTPVPGGTGPVTTAVLGRNLLQAARLQLESSTSA